MVKMMIVCVLAFTLCWLPFNIIIILGDYYNVYEYEYIEYIWVATHWLAMSHAVYNPVIYITMNPRFRYGFRRVLGKCVPCLLPESNGQTANGRSMAIIFNSSQQRKRLASQYNCYAYGKGNNSSSQAMVHCQSARGNQLLLANHGANAESSRHAAQKRFSCVPTNSSERGPTRNGKLNSHSEMVKSQSYNCASERNEDKGTPTQEDSLL